MIASTNLRIQMTGLRHLKGHLRLLFLTQLITLLLKSQLLGLCAWYLCMCQFWREREREKIRCLHNV